MFILHFISKLLSFSSNDVERERGWKGKGGEGEGGGRRKKGRKTKKEEKRRRECEEERNRAREGRKEKEARKIRQYLQDNKTDKLVLKRCGGGQRRRDGITKVSKENDCQPRNLYLVNIVFKDEEKPVIPRHTDHERICH